MVNVALGRVDIFRNFLVGFQCSSTTAQGSSGHVMNWEHDSATTAIVSFATFFLDNQSSARQILIIEALCFRMLVEVIPTFRRLCQFKFVNTNIPLAVFS